MATKQIYFNRKARQNIGIGVNKVGNAARVSLGVQGRTVVIGRRNGSELTKDGYDIVKNIFLEDLIERIGADIIKEVAFKTVKLAGDNTTTATLLAQDIYNEGIKIIDQKKWWQFWKSSRNVNSVEVKRGIDRSIDEVVKKLQSMSETIDINSVKLNQVASISANNDSFVGDKVAEIFRKTGKDGIVGIERSSTYETYTEMKEGLVLDNGYSSPFFSDNDGNNIEFKNPYILVSEGKISTKNEILPILSAVINEKKPLLVIAEDVEGEALFLLITQKIKGNYPVCVVKAPGFGDNQKDFIKDIALSVGANVANDASGLRLDTLQLTDLGNSEKVLITKDETTILGGGGEKRDIDAQVLYIKKIIEDAKSDYERKQYEIRLAKLIGGIGIIFIGAATDIEYKELAARYDDALRATRAAMEEGIVCGGGVALIRCINTLNLLDYDTEDEKDGIKLIQKILESPFRQMASNAGINVSINEVKEGKGNYGYNFKTGIFEDLVEAGVIDATKVIRVALQTSSSVAGTLLTCEAMVVNEDEPLPMMPNRR